MRWNNLYNLDLKDFLFIPWISVECLLILIYQVVLDAFSMKVLHFCSSPKPWDPDAKKGDLEQTLERWLGTSIVCCIWLTVSSFRRECCRLTRLCDYLLRLEGITFFVRTTEGGHCNSWRHRPLLWQTATSSIPFFLGHVISCMYRRRLSW